MWLAVRILALQPDGLGHWGPCLGVGKRDTGTDSDPQREGISVGRGESQGLGQRQGTDADAGATQGREGPIGALPLWPAGGGSLLMGESTSLLQPQELGRRACRWIQTEADIQDPRWGKSVPRDLGWA